MFTGLLNITQGSSFNCNFNITDCAGSPINLSGISGFAPLKLTLGSSGLLDQFNFNVVSAESGICNLNLTPNQTCKYPVTQGIYETTIYNGNLNSGAFQQQVAFGYININPECFPNFTEINVLDGGTF